MAQKFIGLDDAAKQLGVEKDRLNELREAGQLRAYRDGASWKFRSEEIDELAKTGLPEIAPDSAIGFGAGLDEEDGSDDFKLDLDDDTLGAASEAGDDLEVGKMSELGDLNIADDVGASIELEDGIGLANLSGIDVEETIDEPTVAADEDEATTNIAPHDAGSDDDLVLDIDGSGDDAESILLSEADLGDNTDRPPSTIIGKNELALDDDDLQLAPSESAAASVSDVQLADDQDDDILSLEPAGSEVIPGAGAAPSGKFEDLDELEIDLEAESSRILEAEDVAAAQAAQQAQQKAPADKGDSDLSLAASDSDLGLAGLSSVESGDVTSGSEASLTGISSLDIDNESGSGSLTGLSSIELAEDEDDDFVLGDSGSDITLAGGDSGINLVPADSGISLDDAALSGAAIGSSIDLGEIAGASDLGQDAPSGDLASGEEFLLTPISEGDEDEEDSSQIIALEAVEEDESADALLAGDAMDLSAEPEAMATGASAPVAAEAVFPMWIMALLGSCISLMMVCGIMMVDVVRNIWSWEEPYSPSSAIIEGLLGVFGG